MAQTLPAGLKELLDELEDYAPVVGGMYRAAGPPAGTVLRPRASSLADAPRSPLRRCLTR